MLKNFTVMLSNFHVNKWTKVNSKSNYQTEKRIQESKFHQHDNDVPVKMKKLQNYWDE